jgi:hypothetical protein
MKRLILMVAFVLPCLLVSANMRASVIAVDCMGSGLTTIQEGVDAAADGDTILIAPCVYEEQVSVQDKRLTFDGSGADVTELLWQGSGSAVYIGMPSWGAVTIRDMRITRPQASASAIYWDDHRIVLEDCEITGRVGGGYYYGEAIVDNCTMTSLGVGGGMRCTEVSDSRIGRLSIGGVQFQAGNALRSKGSCYTLLDLGPMVGASCSGDSIGTVSVPGGLDCYSTLSAEDCVIDSVFGSRSPEIMLDRCVVGELRATYEGWCYPVHVPLSLRYCLVEGSVIVESEWASAVLASADPGGQRQIWGLRLLHNTILGDLVYPVDVPVQWSDEHWVRGNIVVGQTELYGGDFLVISHNDFLGGFEYQVHSDSIYANISQPPLFCDPLGQDYTLEDCSPCVGASHDGGNMGAFDVGCDCTAVLRKSWGAIKGMFR